MSSLLRLALPYILSLLVGLAAGWWLTSNHWQTRYSDQRAEHNDMLRRTAEANAAVILEQQSDLQRESARLSELDSKHTEEISDALSENRRLESLYSSADDERRRLRIEVRVARNDATVSETTGSGSMGDATSLELSGAAGRTVWDIRRGMKEDQAKIRYLQSVLSGQQ